MTERSRDERGRGREDRREEGGLGLQSASNIRGTFRNLYTLLSPERD